MSRAHPKNLVGSPTTDELTQTFVCFPTAGEGTARQSANAIVGRPTSNNKSALSALNLSDSPSQAVVTYEPARPDQAMRAQRQLSEHLIVALVCPACPKGRGAILEELGPHVTEGMVLSTHLDLQLTHGMQVFLRMIGERLCNSERACATRVLLDDHVNPDEGVAPSA